MVCYINLSEFKRFMDWKIIIKEFGTNIQHKYGVDNMVADTIIRMLPAPNDQDESSKRKY